MKKIPLTQGKEALVDDDWFDYLNQWNWCANKIGWSYYVVRQSPSVSGKQSTICMHRVILGLKKGEKRQVDHIDGNGLNNQVDNLRVCNRSQNGCNCRKHIDNSSGYKGVTWDKTRKKWYVQIRVNGQQCFLGRFTDKIEAAKAYDKAALKHYGEFARLNFSEETYDR